MKRMSSSDSLAALIPSCPSAAIEDKGSASNKNAYVRGFQSMLDSFQDDDSIEESCPVAEKKRRLSVEQVKALEKNFEVENKLEPDRKVRLAQELGLQPRQVAVWFQNRRARWKTKQLEKDYSALKADYEALKLNCDALRCDNDALLVQIKELKSKDGEKNIKSSCNVKEEIIQSDADVKISEKCKIENDVEPNQDQCKDGIFTFGDLKDGSSDSDSSVILNDDNGAYGAISPEFLPQEPLHISSILRFDCTFSASQPSSSINYLHFPDYSRGVSANTQKLDLQIMRNEEHNFLNGGDETCNFFEEEQAPNLSWYCTEPWN